MWEVLDEAFGKKAGLAKGEAFEKSVEARSEFKRASVGHGHLMIPPHTLPQATYLEIEHG